MTDGLIEALAALEHRQWMAWSQHVAEHNDIPESLREQWEVNWKPYDELDEAAKEKDRVWARKAADVLPTRPTGDCKCAMRPFHFQRVEDESGTSGTGIVAEGVEFSDGSVVLHWFNEDNPDLDTAADGFAFKPGPDGVRDTLLVHGHGNKTHVVFHDGERVTQEDVE